MSKMVITLALAVVLRTPILNAHESPYPLSDFIKAVEWDKSSIVTYSEGSDQWPMTWASDGHLYGVWGDGWGWAESGDQKRSMGVTRIVGMPPDLKGEDLWGEGTGSGFGKPEAIIALGDTLHMFWTKGKSKNDEDNTYTALSVDGGRTWTLGSQRAFPQFPDGFRVRGICQFGPGNTGAPDDNVYVYFGFNRHPEIYLASVPKQRLFDPSQYKWFQTIHSNGAAMWTNKFNQKEPVFYDPSAYLWHIGISYNPGLDRYMLTKPHLPHDYSADTELEDSGMASLGIFDAPTPWGPWTTVLYEDHFIDDKVKFSYYFPPKFISEDGRSLWLAWSGWPEYDSLSFISCRFIFESDQ